MNNTTLFSYVQNNKDDDYALQVIYYLMRTILLESNFNIHNVKSINISGKFLQAPLSVDIGTSPSHELDGLMQLLFIRAIMLDKSYLKLCYDDSPLFKQKSKTTYEWVDWMNVINECLTDEDFNQILDCINSITYKGSLSESEIEEFKQKTIAPPYRYLLNYYKMMADNNDKCEEVIKSNAYVCDETLEDYVTDTKVGYIGNTAFAYCENLSSITFTSPEIQFGHFPIIECNNLKHIFVPAESVAYYKNELPYFSDIIESKGSEAVKGHKEEIVLPQLDIEEKIEEIKEEEVEKPKTEPTERVERKETPIDFNRIYEVFKNVSTSYKFFWFMSILSIIKRKQHITISLHEMVAEMLSIVWPIIFEYNLDLGKTDSLKSITRSLSKIAPLGEKSSPNIVRQYINEHYDRVKKSVSPLLENVPYRFLSPWIKFISTSDVIQKSNDETLASPYAFIDDNIVFDEDWYDYINKNMDKLTKFTKESLLDYLKKNNSEMDLLKYKLKDKQ